MSDEQRRDGVAVIDKPVGWTSHDVVAKTRGILHNKKIGHSGTLDPDATGVLVLGVGRVTRLLRYLTALSKSYVGEMALGIETSTLDAAGEVVATHDMSAVTSAQVSAVARSFVGPIEQVPPMVSAVRVGGKRLHEMAREGQVIERDPRPVTVHRLEVTPVKAAAGIYRLDVDCSSGTFIRTLAADIGEALGGGAHLRSLRRTAIGSFTVDEATTIEGVTVLPPALALRDYDSVTVSDEVAAAVGFGKVLPLDRLGVDGDGPWAVLDATGALLAVYEPHKGEAKPSVVVAPAGQT